MTPQGSNSKALWSTSSLGPKPPQESGRLSKQACPTWFPLFRIDWCSWAGTWLADKSGIILQSGMSPERLWLYEECSDYLSASCQRAAWGSSSQASWSFLQLSLHTEFSTHLKTYRPALSLLLEKELPVIYFQSGCFWTDRFINWRNFIILQGQLRHQGQVGPLGTLPFVHLSAYIKTCLFTQSICTHIICPIWSEKVKLILKHIFFTNW